MFSKKHDKNKHKKRIESLSDYNDKSDVYIDTESDIGKLYQLRVAQMLLWL